MSRYPPAPDYRARDRSRSPPHFVDRRASTASIFDNRPSGPARSASDAPRGPRSQYDSARPPLPPGPPPGGMSNRGFTSLRDAPPLGSSDRGRPYRERDYDRRDRPPSPLDRSPRTFPPRDLDISRQRRDSRDGPPAYPDSQPLSAGPFRGGFARGRGRGDFPPRGSRGGRGAFEDRELIRRPERSPPPRAWGRDLSRDSRDADRRDDRGRFDRRDDERRPVDWPERDRDFDRPRRDPLPPRLEGRNSNESIGSANATFQSSQAPRINPDRLALIEGAGVDNAVRKPSVQQDAPPAREVKREVPETPAYLNGRAATAANRYSTRGSSSPQQAPPVPAFSWSLAPSTTSAAPPTQTNQPSRSVQDTTRAIPRPSSSAGDLSQKPIDQSRPAPPPDAPTAPRAPPPAPKALLAGPPPAAPRGPRAQDADDIPPSNRLQQVRSLENLPSQMSSQHTPLAKVGQPTSSFGSTGPSSLPTLNQPVTPHVSNPPRFGDLGPPTGPRASRTSPGQVSVSPRPPFASPRSDFSAPSGPSSLPRTTPPLTAPTGPRSRPFSVSPKAAPPTAPKGQRGPPLAPRGIDRGPAPASRAPDRLTAPAPWAPPSAPRSLQWNQWKRPGVSAYGDKTIPVKRDVSGEEKRSTEDTGASLNAHGQAPTAKSEGTVSAMSSAPTQQAARLAEDEMDVDKQPPKRQSSLMSGHSAKQSFFGKPVESVEEDENDTGMSEAGQDLPSTSEDESDTEDDTLTLFHAKFERQKRQLEAQMVDLRQSPYRAMSPLESISRLVRISPRDLQRVNEMREREMDVDDSPVANNQHLVPRSTRSSDSADGPVLLTPRGEEDHKVAVRSSDDSVEGICRIRRPTPEPITLPYLLKEGRHSMYDSTLFQTRDKAHLESEQDAMDILEDDVQEEENLQDDVEEVFVDEFRRWKEGCEDVDRWREEQEKLERQQSLEPGPELDAPMAPPIVPFEGSRRLHKFNSEYEFEQVLKQSEETARIEQERQDREAKKNQADMEKEAVVPDQTTEEELRRGTFVDSNRYRDPESLTEVFSYDPATDDFTENEQHIFIAAFKETPKKWGEIASLLPGRTYEDCIRHYYAKKWDGRFRDNRTKKLKAGGRRGRGGARGPRGRMGGLGLMADLHRQEDMLSADAMSEKGRPRRAAAPTTFGEKEIESKASLLGQSPAKKPGPGGKADSNGDAGSEKSGKRQKKTGEKPGRKAKSTQPLLAAAAPHGSPAKQFLQRQDQAQQQKLEEASLLANLQVGHHGSIPFADGQMVYAQERVLQPMAAPEEPDRYKTAGQGPAAKQSASSYWSVPEQNDFVKYVAHFGRDFAAIAAHMGTKTQTMIKNHYQRQVEGGNRPELENSAVNADDRRARGDDIGPPPTPTPIQKRKYDSVPSSAQRPLAPQGDAMEVDESGPPSRVQLPKHASPPQYQNQPRMTMPSQNTPIPASRVAPSPPTSTAAPAQAQMPMGSQMRPSQYPPGSRLTFMADNRTDPRPTGQPGFTLRAAEDPASRPPSQQATRPAAVTPDLIAKLEEEQQRAIRQQQERQQPQPQAQHQPERVEQLQRHNVMLRNPSQGSPLNQPLHQSDWKLATEERAPSPPRPGFMSSTFSRPGFSSFGTGAAPPFSSMGSRSNFGISPMKREEPRPASMATIPPASAPPATSTPSEPKRSNVMSLLNNDDEPQPPRRDNPPSAPQRTSSPAPQALPRSGSISTSSNIPGMRREPSFGQPSMPGQLGRGPFGQPNANTASGPPTPKHENMHGHGPISQTPKPDWTSGFYRNSNGQGQSNPNMERDARPLFQPNHRTSLLGSLGQPRGNPSPPPLGGMNHSRTPSLTGQTIQQAHEQPRGSLLGQHQQSSHPPAQALQPNPYGNQQIPPFSQAPPSQAQNHAHHSHNSSLSGQYPTLHHRGHSRGEQFRPDQRDRDEREMRLRHQESERQEQMRQEEEQRHFARQQQQQEQERSHMFHQHRPQPLQPPPPFSGAGFVQNQNRGPLGLRRQSEVDSERAMMEEMERQQRGQNTEMRRQEAIQREQDEYHRRRQQEDAVFRRTPLGGGYGPPSQPPRR